MANAKTRKERLPPHVSSFVDRHGKRRYRWRHKGHSAYFQHHPNSPEGKAELEAFAANAPADPAQRHTPGTVAWALARYLASPAFLGRKNSQTEQTSRLILDKFVSENDVGQDRIADFRFDHIEAVLMKAARPWADAKGRKRGGPSAANNLRGELKPFFDYAIKLLGLMQPNPVDQAAPISVPRGGFHTWTEAEIAQYRAHHALGTMARLALEIFLWTAQRRGDASTFGRRHIVDGRFEFHARKTDKTMWLPIAPQLLEAIEATKVTGTETYLVTEFGKPFSRAGLGNKMRQWCDEAGLPHCSAHGLRKATTRRAAELGASDRELMGLGGWTTSKQVGVYTAAVEQRRMAEQALSPVIDFDLSNRSKE
jgi:integrase